MRWRNHKIVTLAAVYALTGGLTASVASMFGSVLPDVLEIRYLVPHRTITHSLWGWLALCAFLWFAFIGGGATSVLLYLLFFMAGGAVLHVCEDALSIGGIPLKTPFGQSIGLKVYRTGTIGEEITAAGLLVVFAVAAWARGFTTSEHLRGQFLEIFNVIRGILHGW